MMSENKNSLSYTQRKPTKTQQVLEKRQEKVRKLLRA